MKGKRTLLCADVRVACEWGVAFPGLHALCSEQGPNMQSRLVCFVSGRRNFNLLKCALCKSPPPPFQVK